MNPDEFWQPSEERISSFSDLKDIIDRVFLKWSSRGKTFAWRGQSDATWPLYSSLYRRLFWTKGSPPDEEALHAEEGKILAELHRWGLHVSPSVGRLSVLNQLAALQHYGAPTRLIDITFNPWISAWFAVEAKYNNGSLAHDIQDARLFAIDVTRRLINEESDLRGWEDELHRPWPHPKHLKHEPEKKEFNKEWRSKVFAWKPPHFDGRIAAQNGGFLFGGVPSSVGPNGPNQWSKEAKGETWKIEEVRRCTSVSLKPHKLNAKRGGVSQDAVYSFRIEASCKAEIREQLEKNFGYKHSSIYPDFTGFSTFGTPLLKSKP